MPGSGQHWLLIGLVGDLAWKRKDLVQLGEGKQKKVPRGLQTGAPVLPCSDSHAGPGSKLGAFQGGSSIPESGSENRWRLVYMGLSLSSPASQLITKRVTCGLWAAPSNAASPWKQIRTQGVVLWSPVHAHSVWRLWLPHSTFPELTKNDWTSVLSLLIASESS